jgi:hypothetical protein
MRHHMSIPSSFGLRLCSISDSQATIHPRDLIPSLQGRTLGLSGFAPAPAPQALQARGHGPVLLLLAMRFHVSVFCNRSIDLSTIKFYGFDMDYTLAVYKACPIHSRSSRASRHRFTSLFTTSRLRAWLSRDTPSPSLRASSRQRSACAGCSSTKHSEIS